MLGIMAAVTFMGMVDGWEINRSEGRCMMGALFPDQNIAGVVIEPDGTAYLRVGNPNWRSITLTSYPVTLQLGKKVWNIQADGFESETAKGFQIPIDPDVLSRSMMFREQIVVTTGGKTVFSLVPRSGNAIAMVQRCAKGSADPFAP